MPPRLGPFVRLTAAAFDFSLRLPYALALLGALDLLHEDRRGVVERRRSPLPL
jgi:hypothetical protein